MIRIVAPKGDFDLYEDFAAELYLNNVMLTDEGEMTVPMTLLPTPNNLRNVEYGHRIDNYYKPIDSLEVEVHEGSFYSKCRMEIFSISADDGISYALYLNNGGFAALVGDKKVGDLNWDVIKYSNKYHGAENLAKSSFAFEFRNLLESNTNYKFPQVVSTYKYNKRFFNNSSLQLDEGLCILNEYNIFMNEVEYSSGTLPLLTKKMTNISQYGGDTVIQVSNGDKYWCPAHFAIAPFMSFRYFLEKLFNFYDYSFSYDDFTNYNSSFEKLILLHHNADTMIRMNWYLDGGYNNCSGTFLESQIVPNIRIKDVISEIQKNFAGRFIFNKSNKTVKFLFYNDVLTQEPDMDLTPYMVSRMKIEPRQKTKLRLINKNVKTEKPEEQTDEKFEVETIEFNFLPEATVIDTMRNKMIDLPNKPIWKNPIKMNMVKIGDIQTTGNKQDFFYNTTFEINNDVPDELLLSYYDENSIKIGRRVYNDVNTGIITDLDEWFKYRTTEKVFSKLAGTDIDGAEIQYEKYREFKENSNIKITCKMNMPKSVLNNINLQKPKLLDGQKVLIERIITVLGRNDIFQVFICRTLRKYRDRPN